MLTPAQYLVQAHERNLLLIPLPEAIYELRQMVKKDNRWRSHLAACEEALQVILARLTGVHGEARCPVCHRRQETRGHVFVKHGVAGAPMCSGSGRSVGA